MATRSALLIALIAALWGCAGTDDHPPQADQPKTTAELLIGTWDEVMLNGMPIPPARAGQIEFTHDGRFVIRINDHESGNVGVKTGTYTLQGNILRITSNHPVDQGASWEFAIVSITADDLVTADPPGSDRRADRTFKRVSENVARAGSKRPGTL